MKITKGQLRRIIREEISKESVKIVASGFEMFGKTRVDVKVTNIETLEIMSSEGFKDLTKADEHIEALFKKHPNHTYEVDTKSDKIRDALPKPKP